MKKLFALICALFVVAGASAQTPSAGWKIGDTCYVKGKQAVVFAVSDYGQHGKAVSVDQTYDDWVDAEAWCRSLGAGWSLPSRSDCDKLHLVINKINEVLKCNGFKEIKSATYWSRECVDEYNAHAFFICAKFISEFTYNKYNSECNVIAVYSF